ncbi:hypothetical protein R0131_11670 [Clostridium sp. AL.422]|uniref:hypothetical protein n=1 Tax=Clostridium TaxID=1485 RepID=UPI00293DD53E|nr:MULTISPECIES: hypothetical protein [unclassified Clostridium]MDV4151485.1 hypothetical protein [Clostridium sp. AL.422]
MDNFYEQFQTKDYEKIEKTFNIFSKLSLAMAIVFAALLNLVGSMFFILIYSIIFILSRKIIIEYEYELTGNELSIYKIMNKSKRKEIGNFNIREISSVKTLDKLGSNTKVTKAYLEESGIKPMVFITKNSNGNRGFQLAMDEKLLDLVKRVNPLSFY